MKSLKRVNLKIWKLWLWILKHWKLIISTKNLKWKELNAPQFLELLLVHGSPSKSSRSWLFLARHFFFKKICQSFYICVWRVFTFVDVLMKFFLYLAKSPYLFPGVTEWNAGKNCKMGEEFFSLTSKEINVPDALK